MKPAPSFPAWCPGSAAFLSPHFGQYTIERNKYLIQDSGSLGGGGGDHARDGAQGLLWLSRVFFLSCWQVHRCSLCHSTPLQELLYFIIYFLKACPPIKVHLLQ